MSGSEQVLQVFQEWDVDADGLIRKLEFANVLAALGFPEADIDPVFSGR